MSAPESTLAQQREIAQYLFRPGTFDGWDCRAVDGSGAAMRVDRQSKDGSWVWEVNADAEAPCVHGPASSRDNAILECIVTLQQAGVDMTIFPREKQAAEALLIAGEVLPVIATDFNDGHRYNVEVKSSLVKFFPLTDFRPEAMRVSERVASNGTWYEVETFNQAKGRWIEQKTHPDKDLAVADALGWYPDPEQVSSGAANADSSDLISMQRGALDSLFETREAILNLPRIQTAHGEVVSYEEICKLFSAQYIKPTEKPDVKRWADGDFAKFGMNNETEVAVFAGLFRVSGFGVGNYYGADHVVESVDADTAIERAKREGVQYVRWDSDRAYPPVGFIPPSPPATVPGQLRDWESDQEATSFAEAQELAAVALNRLGLTAVSDWRTSPAIGRWEYLDIQLGEQHTISVGASEGGVVSIGGDPFTPGDRLTNVTLSRVMRSIETRVKQHEQVFGKAASADTEEPSGSVFAFPGMNSVERDELLEALRDGGNKVVAMYGDNAKAVLREANQELATEYDDPSPA